MTPLDWSEWLACLAIGLGSFVVSFLTRFITRNCCTGSDGVLVMRRVGNGRNGSGRHIGGGGGSMRGSMGGGGSLHGAPGNGSMRMATGNGSMRQSGTNKVVPVTTVVDGFKA